MVSRSLSLGTYRRIGWFYVRFRSNGESPRIALPATGIPASICSSLCLDNLNGLRFAGVESSLTWQPAQNHSVHVAWTALSGAQDALDGLQSEYVFNYPVQNVHATWSWAISRGIAISNAVHIAQRYKRTAYPVWDAAVARERGLLRPYLRLQNLSDTGYQEIAGVTMPGRSIVGGISIWLGR
jgi:hypothetical protein